MPAGSLMLLNSAFRLVYGLGALLAPSAMAAAAATASAAWRPGEAGDVG